MIRPNRGDETLDEQYSTIWSRHGDGPEPSAADFLAEHPDASMSECLDVLLTDQLLRWRCDRPRPVGDYLAEHPSLADDPEAILKLVQGEFLARLARGEAPEPDSYIRMFPGLAEEIRLQCEVNRWLTLPSPSDPSSMPTTADYRGGDATDDGSGPASVSPLPGDLDAPLAGADFELVRPLGSGGMGEVYEAVQKSLRKRVALKLIRRDALDSPSRVRRFFAEARALARLRHPQIVGVHGIGRMADGRYFLVMDLIEGGTTLAALLREGPVPFDRAAGLVATVADAIEHAHSRGVIHRDLKPSNVLLDAEGRPHVTDFGLAKVFDSVAPDDPQTTADQILGTPHYMAPEQADRARGPITPRTDVYALGGLLYALLTGQPPIQGDSLTAILTRVISPEPVPTPRALRGDAPAALERICRTCLEKDAEKRYPSAAAVAEALRAWLANPEAEDSAAVAAGFPGPTTRSSDDPDTGQSRSGWATDRSLKDGRRTPNPGPWAPKAARSAGTRRRTWAAGAVASTLALLLIAVPLVWMQIDGDKARVAVWDASRAPSTPLPSQPESNKVKASVADHAEDPNSLVVAQRTVPPDSQSLAPRLKKPPDPVASRPAEAVALHEATLERMESQLGPDHPNTLSSRQNLASAYLAAGRAAEAERLLRGLLDRQRAKPPADHPALAGTLATLGPVLLDERKWAEAESVLRECLAIRQKAQPDEWSTFDTRSQLGGSLLGQGRFAEAEALIVTGYEGMKAREARIPAQDGPRLAEAARRVVALYEAWGKPDKAAIAFYRGRVDDESKATADVSPGPEKEPVTITIGANRAEWARKYKGVNPDTIKDQFEIHPHEGYMHLGGSLDYLLTIRNQFPKELNVECVVELTDRADAQANQGGNKLLDDDLKLGPRGSPTDTRTFPGKVSLSKAKPEETRVLRVSLEVANPTAPAGNPKAAPWKNKEFKVTFSQVNITRYMSIRDKFVNPCNHPQHEPNQQCYVVTYKRLGDDPFTEPIRADRWRCQIVDRPATLRPEWILPGNPGWEFHYHPADQGNANYPWFGEIENEEIEGNVGRWNPKKQSQSQQRP